MSRDALVVGINTYQSDRLTNLPAPSEDAEAIAQLLERYGDFKVTRLPAVTVRSLILEKCDGIKAYGA